MRAPLRGLLFLCLASGCLASCGLLEERLDVWPVVESTPQPSLVVYYPEHGTWNTWFTSTVVRLDGSSLGRLHEGAFLVLPIDPGTHVLSASTDDAGDCSEARSGAWPPLDIVVGHGPVFVRFGVEPYQGDHEKAPICYRRLVRVPEQTARREVSELDRIEVRER